MRRRARASRSDTEPSLRTLLDWLWSTYPGSVKNLQAPAVCFVKPRDGGGLAPPSCLQLQPLLVVAVVALALDAEEGVGARGAGAFHLDAVAVVEVVRNGGREVRGHRAVDAGDGDDVSGDGEVAVQLDRLRLGRPAAARREHDGVAAEGAAAELAVREPTRRRPVSGQVGDESAPRGRAVALREAGDVRAAGDDALEPGRGVVGAVDAQLAGDEAVAGRVDDHLGVDRRISGEARVACGGGRRSISGP